MAKKQRKPISAHRKLQSILVTGGAGFIGSNLTLELQRQNPDTFITVIDDFRSGDFKNLDGFSGDIIAKDLAKLDFEKQFKGQKFDVIFHLASITDTTNHDQLMQTHDNVESFRGILNFAKPTHTPIVYASSAATYGMVNGVNKETDRSKPANAYAFSKVILDNLVKKMWKAYPKWQMRGVRYFNVYGPKEAHKGVPASMIWHLSQQIKAGKNPRIFKHGEQMRDFVYVKDAVRLTIAALSAPVNAIFNTGSGTPRSFNDLIQILNQTLGTNRKTEYFDNPYAHYQNHTEADLALAKKHLKYTPEYSLEKGVQDYMQWVKENLK